MHLEPFYKDYFILCTINDAFNEWISLLITITVLFSTDFEHACSSCAHSSFLPISSILKKYQDQH